MRPWSAPPSPFSPSSPSALPMSSTSATTPPASPRPRRTRPLTEQIQVIRELWLLREQARVQAAERRFLAELERLLSGRASQEDAPRPPVHVRTMDDGPTRPPPPPPPPPPGVATMFSVPAAFVEDGPVFESHPPPRRESAPVREMLGATEREVEQLRSRQRVTVCCVFLFNAGAR